MGVDYEAVFGIGVEVEAVDDEDKETDLGEKIERLDYKDLYRYRSAGDNYDEKYYIFMKNPFDNGYDITEKVWDFCEWLKDNKVIYKGRVDICGDLCVW